MTQQKHPFHTAFVLLMFILLITYSIYRLYHHFVFESLPRQLSSGFQVVYIDASYVLSIASLLLCPTLLVYILFDRMTQLVKVPIKVITITIVLSLIVAIPGQIFEFGRLKYIAENNGYSACPPFTIASSGKFVEAMVKEEKYCIEPEINRIGMYGYFHELERIDNYIKSHRNDIQ
ncbi:hypothetical protein ACU6D0_003661 [Vibrio alginolyticus]|uniref:hypothetical protein n=1 Tax=Vibrio TaxID=662 RepID=UPI0006D15371|nr:MULTISPECIES: hypothetical protein [Vibrio]MDW1812623.1 hypothetical protein [Vibrio sp. Vb2362]EGR2324421.1 hypothetical protein [Vibrio alginolyticus]EGR2557869.1 hypothetical protein [Vibrio alginolyticus]EJV5742744.1 hypothetical protein [Vibrio alginolyticus]EKD1483680.1 hypothetical protein [Vibrio alginolyticus]